MRKKHIGMIFLFVVLIGSDLLIGFNGHYAGTTGGDYSFSSFTEYVSTLTFMDMIPVVLIALGVFFYVEWRFGAL